MSLLLKGKELLQKSNPTGFEKILLCILFFLSLPFSILVSLRNFLYEKGLLKSEKPRDVYVVSVGNIVAGGVGKTPFLIKLLKDLQSKDQIGILARGVNCTLSPKIPLKLFAKHGFSAEEIGDEPFLLTAKFPQIPVFLTRNRKASAFLAAKEGKKLLLLDDGMQYRKLKKDEEVVVLDSQDLFGLGYFLPRGFLREAPTSLKRASLVVLSRMKGVEDYDLLRQQIKRYTPAPVIGIKGFLSSIDFPGSFYLSRGEKVALFSAIGSPAQFKESVSSWPLDVVDEWILDDHASLPSDQLKQFCERALKRGAKALICTEKDATKISPSVNLALPVGIAKLDLEVVAGEKEYQQFLNRLNKAVLI